MPKADEEKTRNRCERCEEFLHPAREVWLEFDTRTLTYTNEEVPQEHSQGSFCFGPACAKRELARHKASKKAK